ncbi:MAG: glycosyltransferase [Candidatus Saccharimonadales bacterium]
MNKKSGSFFHLFFYGFLFLLLLLSISGLIASFWHPHIWEVYKRIYFLTLLAYVWYIFILLFIGEIRKEPRVNYTGERIGVIVPVFNEDPQLFKKCLASLDACKGNKKVMVIDDGSTKNLYGNELKRLCQMYDFEFHAFSNNKGKRHVLHHAVKQLAEECKYIVTIDSDTVLKDDALEKIVAPLENANVGATTGNVLLLNEKQNVLTRMVGAYYWIGLEVFKKAQSTYGFVVCCSGCIAAYRSEIILKIIDEFVGQKFLGQDCTHSEDRHLTNLTLRDGWLVKYIPEAVSYTYTPATVKGFLKQQQRWKRGYIRESTYTLTYAWKTRKLLFLESFFCELTIPFIAFGLMLDLLMTVILRPGLFLTQILPFWIVFMLVRYSPLFIRAPRKAGGLLVYAVFYDLFLYWQCIYALFTVKNRSWITRI